MAGMGEVRVLWDDDDAPVAPRAKDRAGDVHPVWGVRAPVGDYLGERVMNRRRYDHINRGERVFLPQSRMRHIRWEEAVARAHARREGEPSPVFSHSNCHCGSVECLGVPFVQRRR